MRGNELSENAYVQSNGVKEKDWEALPKRRVNYMIAGKGRPKIVSKEQSSKKNCKSN